MRTESLILAIASVNGASDACATLGDVVLAIELQAHYGRVAEAASRAGGRVLKVIGDGVLLAFPTSRAADALDAVRAIARDGTERWREVDAGCRVAVRVGAGEVVSDRLGPPGAERPDVYGDVLNQLFRLPPVDGVTTTPAVDALLA